MHASIRRAEGLAQQVLERAAPLPSMRQDPVLGLGGAAVLLALSSPDAHPSYLATDAAQRLAALLLNVSVGDGGGAVFVCVGGGCCLLRLGHGCGAWPRCSSA